MKSDWWQGWGRGAALLLVTVLGFAGTVRAAGFSLMEQGVKELGTAYAGSGALAEDATTVYYNPAGLTLLKGQQVSVGGHLIKTSFAFTNEGSTQLLTPLTGEGLTGNNGGDAGSWNAVPNGYYTANLGNGFAYGLGVGVPFGLTTKYAAGWVGRYHTLRSRIFTVNINPSVAYALTDKLSLGAGFDAMYMDAHLSQAIDFGTLLAAAGDTPQRDDGSVDLKADNWGYGFNVGVLYQLNAATRIGLSYRSKVIQRLKGSADFTVPPTAQAILNGLGSTAFRSGAAAAKVTLPASAALDLYHRCSPRLVLLARVGWMGWSTLKELRIHFANSAQPDSVTTLDWRDTWQFSLGATYAVTPVWDLRLGSMFDQTPIPNDQKRTARLPDQSRIWATLGTTYRATRALSVDLAYAHLFMTGSSKIEKTPTGEDATRGGLMGSYDSMGDIVSAQLNYVW